MNELERIAHESDFAEKESREAHAAYSLIEFALSRLAGLLRLVLPSCRLPLGGPDILLSLAGSALTWIMAWRSKHGTGVFA